MAKLVEDVFATRNDWLPRIERVEEELKPLFVAMGLFQSPEVPILSSLQQEENLGISFFGNAPLERAYWICKGDTEVSIREVPQRKGPPMYTADMGDQPVAVVMRPGGIFGEKCIIAGQLGVAGEDENVHAYFNAVSSPLLEGFTKVGAYLVGPEARRLLGRGWRLTYSHKAPLPYDLKSE